MAAQQAKGRGLPESSNSICDREYETTAATDQAVKGVHLRVCLSLTDVTGSHRGS